MSQQALRRGDLVEVKSPSEILVTLDERGALSDLPFMPEMVSYCGRRFAVERRAEKVCDTIDYTGSRRLHDSVLLDDLRCDGSGHDGCQAECRLFWKEAWLRKVSPQEPPHPPFPPGELSALIERASRHARSTVRIDGKDQQRYRCQSTDLTKCTEHLKLWDLRAYVREYTSGNIRLGHFLRVTTRAALQEPMRKLGLVPEVHVAGTAKKGDVFESLDLRPGDLVRVKTKEEIAATLNAEGRNKGLWFDREMLPYCGGTFRVRQRLNRFINDRDGSLVVLKNDGVTLDGVVCSGDLSLRRWFCPRNIYPFWRECWLERVEPTAEPASGSPRELAPWPSDRSRSSEE
jgi:DNA-directed RNA polymerase subunit H (RpoH/RPB5)